ncbi:hypothetical protein [Actinomadura luteofluorescens]|uniref:hypothetical protein n=1 Tax=Actinomadura luteofluorescens TaxID=46163 RepID=UPI003D947604
MSTSPNLVQVRADVRARLTGRTRMEITRAACTAKDNRDAAVSLRERHGDAFAASARQATAAYDEHKQIWRSMKGQPMSAVYEPTVEQPAA